MSENLGNISIITFRRRRPFYCLIPKVNDRQQCLCLTCSNLQHLCNALCHNNALPSRDVEQHLDKITCSKGNIKCCTRECELCIEQRAHDPNQIVATQIRFLRWEKVTNDNGYASTKCIEKSDTAVSVASYFEDALEKYAFHRYSFCHQYREIR